MKKNLCFEIIESCPNLCLFCSSNSSLHKKQMISYEDFVKSILYFNSNCELESVSFSGGEPLLHPEFLQMLHFLQEKSIPGILFTSGVKESLPLSSLEQNYFLKKKEADLREIEIHEPWNSRLKKQIEKYYNQYLSPPMYSSVSKNEFLCFKNLGLSKVVFDFEGYLEETDNYLMGRSQILRQAALDSIFNATMVGLEVEIHFIPTKINYKEIEEILELFSIINVKNIHILKFVPQGRGKENQSSLEMDEEEMKEFWEILERARKKFPMQVVLSASFFEEKHVCSAGLQKIHIKFDGTVLPCPAFKELTYEEYLKLGIKHYSIYSNLEEYPISSSGTRVNALCKKLYDT